MAVRVAFPEGKNQIKLRLKKMQLSSQPVIQAYAEDKAEEMERYMKQNHVWKNRTGNAERGLYGKVTTSRKKYVTTIEIGHGKDIWYSVYLEFYYGGRFAIIQPTLDLFGPMVMDDMINIMDGM